ncbi:zeta toxin family protein [Streptomyces sp. NPDC007856]|uniref:zeta toxin family protein n=1 Tax=Streptomyces sp. NPDC007856 TaxID=3364781 RepID=UPI0036898C30
MILPGATRAAVRQDRPVVVVVGGQPGAGKTQRALRGPNKGVGRGSAWRGR